MRDADFSEAIKRVLAQRVCHRCSNPDCKSPTSGPQIDPSKALNIGVAAHITAASLGGPRYELALSSAERQDVTNGIWLCQDCAKLIDNDALRFTVEVLRKWKAQSEAEALDLIGKTIARPSASRTTDIPEGPIPIADPRRFSVALAHLAHDENQELERLIVESLRDLAGVQILRFDRTISAEGAVPEESERSGHEMARALLRESTAEVLIWGTVLSQSGRNVPRLYWTTAESRARSRQPYLPENFQLPQIFWEDLAEILRLVTVTQSQELFARRGQHTAPELAPFVDKVRNLISGSQSREGWTGAVLAQITFICAMGFQKLGEQTSRLDYLAESARYYRDAVREWSHEKFPSEWAAARNGLGVALGMLGSLEPGSALLEEAAEIFCDLLRGEATREQRPALWASVQNNLGNALLRIGERKSEIETLKKAMDAYREAIQEWTRNRFPLDWAILQNNLGYALQVVGNLQPGCEYLLAAVLAHRSALEESTRDRAPMYWAQSQNNLGNALKSLGGRQLGFELLEEAAIAYRLALEERTLEREPQGWAETHNNLGAVLAEIAYRSGNPGGLDEAIAALHEALKVRTREAVPMAFASSKNNLAYALTRLGENSSDEGHFEEAITALNEALEVWTREKVPSRWSFAQQNLGDALLNLGKRRKNTALLEAALDAYGQALCERRRDREPLLWAAIQAAFGMTRYTLGELESGDESLRSAVNHYKQALQEFSVESAPFDRAAAQFNLGNALRSLGVRTKDPALIGEALENHAAACRSCLPSTPYWALISAKAAREDMEALRTNFSAALSQPLLSAYGWIATVLSHSDHELALVPFYTCIVAGRSGTSKPDFGAAPRRGDRITDGTCVWENSGKRLYCRRCNVYLESAAQ
jgi:tetratricopeptide (TPR) repeat protein